MHTHTYTLNHGQTHIHITCINTPCIHTCTHFHNNTCILVCHTASDAWVSDSADLLRDAGGGVFVGVHPCCQVHTNSNNTGQENRFQFHFVVYSLGQTLLCSLNYALTHSFPPSFLSPSLVNPLSLLLIHLLTHLSSPPSLNSLTCSFILSHTLLPFLSHSLINSLPPSLTHLFTLPLPPSLPLSFTHSLTLSPLPLPPSLPRLSSCLIIPTWRTWTKCPAHCYSSEGMFFQYWLSLTKSPPQKQRVTLQILMKPQKYFLWMFKFSSSVILAPSPLSLCMHVP